MKLDIPAPYTVDEERMHTASIGTTIEDAYAVGRTDITDTWVDQTAELIGRVGDARAAMLTGSAAFEFCGGHPIVIAGVVGVLLVELANARAAAATQ